MNDVRPAAASFDPKHTHAPGSLSRCTSSSCLRAVTCARFRAVATDGEASPPKRVQDCDLYVSILHYAGHLAPWEAQRPTVDPLEQPGPTPMSPRLFY